MNSRTLVAIDVTERAHIIDVRTEEELEVIEVTQAELVYQTSFYKSLATGGNVSEALVSNTTILFIHSNVHLFNFTCSTVLKATE